MHIQGNKIVISVIIPAYNRAELLPRAIKSVLGQTFQDFELIVVDDGSTDNTKEVVKNFQRKDKRIKYFYQNNSGPAKARNLGIKNAGGEYIAFLDSDEKFLKKKLEKQLKFFRDCNSNVGFIACDKTSIKRNNKGDIISKYHLFDILKKTKKISIEDFLSLRVPINPTSTMIKKNDLVDIGGFDENFLIHEDYDLWIRLCEKYDFKFTKKSLAVQYDWDGRMSKNFESQKKAIAKKYLFKKHFNIYGKHPSSKSVIFRKIGTDYILAGEKKRAIKYFLKAVKAKPLYFRNYLNLVIAFCGVMTYKEFFRRLKKK